MGYNKKNRREETKFQYVCCVIQVETDEGEGIIQVQGMANEKTKKHFSMKENDTSCISMDMVLTVLPEPILVQDNRKLFYVFPKNIDVYEK